MASLGKEVQTHPVVDHIDRLLDGVGVVAHRGDAIADSEQGQDAQELQDLGDQGIREDVAPSHEHLFMMAGGQHHEGIHQRVGMVDAKDKGAVPGKVLPPMNLETTVGGP